MLKLSFVAQKVQSLENFLTGFLNFEVEEPPRLEIFQSFTRQLICRLHELKCLVVSYSSGLWQFQDTALRSVDCTVTPKISMINISSKNVAEDAEEEKIGIWQGDLQVAAQPLERQGRAYKCFDGQLYVPPTSLQTKKSLSSELLTIDTI